MLRRRMMMLLAGQEEEMAEWKLIQEISLKEAQNVAFDIEGLNLSEIYIFANVGITETGNTSLDVNEESGFFTNICTIGSTKYNTIHVFFVGNRLMANEIEDYALQGYMMKIMGIHPKTPISMARINRIKLFRNNSSYTFVEGSTFEIWGR